MLIPLLIGSCAKIFIGKVSGIPTEERKDIAQYFMENNLPEEKKAYFERNLQQRATIYQDFARKCSLFVEQGIDKQRIETVLTLTLYDFLPEAIRLLGQFKPLKDIKDPKIYDAVIDVVPKLLREHILLNVSSVLLNSSELNTTMIAETVRAKILDKFQQTHGLALKHDKTRAKPPDKTF